MLRVLALVGGLAAAGACDRGDAAAGGSADGPAVFAKWCATCHGPKGRPDPGMVARFAVRDLTAPEFRARVTEARVLEQVQKGSDNKLMPSFAGALSEAQMRAVAAWVAAGLPDPPARPEAEPPYQRPAGPGSSPGAAAAPAPR